MNLVGKGCLEVTYAHCTYNEVTPGGSFTLNFWLFSVGWLVAPCTKKDISYLLHWDIWQWHPRINSMISQRLTYSCPPECTVRAAVWGCQRTTCTPPFVPAQASTCCPLFEICTPCILGSWTLRQGDKGREERYSEQSDTAEKASHSPFFFNFTKGKQRI